MVSKYNGCGLFVYRIYEEFHINLMYIYYIVASVIIDFVLYASIRGKGFFKKKINMVNFLYWWCWKSGLLLVCMCV